MAQPSTEVNKVRDIFTDLSDDFMLLAVTLQRINDFGINYYTAYLGTDESPTTDITPSQFVAAVQVMTALATNLTSQQRLAIANMRR